MLPHELDSAILRILDGPEENHERLLLQLCEQFPDHAKVIRARAESCRREMWGGDATAIRSAPAEEHAQAASSQEKLQRLRARPPLAKERYQLEGEVGRGGMGVVLRVRDLDLGRPLAMKVILGRTDDGASSDTPAVDQRVLQRFLDEAQITGQLDHPGVVPVHELGMDDAGGIYFTMRLVRGDSADVIFAAARSGEGGWTQTRALEVILKVCDTMAFAHKKGVLHRDLKPSNVMVGKFGEVYVMDWGLAKVVGQEDQRDIRIKPQSSVVSKIVTARSKDEADSDSPLLTMDGAVVGTPSYMAPEQAEGRIEAMDQRADVYATGAMLYQLLTGQQPYVSPGARVGPYTILLAVQAGPPVPVHRLDRTVPAELVAICDKAMARELEQRYLDMRALADDLRAFLEKRVVRAYRTGSVAELSMWVRRNRGLAAAVAAALLILVVGIVAFAVENGRARSNELLAQTKATEATNEAVRAEVAAADLRRANAELTHSQRRSEGLRLAATARTLLETDPTQALLVAVEGAELCPGLQSNEALLAAIDACREERVLSCPAQVSFACFSSDGARVLTVGEDHVLRVWDPASRAEPLVLAGIGDWVHDVVTLGAGDRIAVRHADGKVKVHALGSGETLAVFGSSQSPIDHITSLRLEDLLVTYRFGPLEVRDPSGRLIRTLQGRLPLRPETVPAVDPGGRCIAAIDAGGSLLVWDAVTGGLDHEIEHVAEDRACILAFDDTGRRLLVAEVGGDRAKLYDLQIGGEPLAFEGTGICNAWIVKERVCLLDTLEGDKHRLRLLGPEPAKSVPVLGLEADIVFAAGRALCRRDNHSIGDLLDLDTGRVLLHVQRNPGDDIGDEIRLSPDGKRVLARTAHEVRIWSVDRPGATRRIANVDRYQGAFDPTGRMVALRGEHEISVRNLDTGDVWTPGMEDAGEMVWSPDGNLLAAMPWGKGRLRVWDVRRRREVLSRDVVGAITILPESPIPLAKTMGFSPDGASVSILKRDGRLQTWSLVDGAGRTSDLCRPLARRVFFVADGREIVTVDGAGTARRWNLATGEMLGEQDLVAADYPGASATWSLSPNGRWLVLGAQTRIDVLARKQETMEGKQSWESAGLALDDGSVFQARGDYPDVTLELTNQGRSTFLGDILTDTRADRQTTVVKSGTQVAGVRAISGPDHLHAIWIGFGVLAVFRDGRVIARVERLPARVECAAFDEAGANLVTGLADGSVSLWAVPASDTSGEVVTLVPAAPFKNGDAGVSCCRFLSGRAKLVTADRQGDVAVWDTASGRRDRSWHAHDAPILGLDVWQGERRMLATAAADGRVRVWRLEDSVRLADLPGHRGRLRDAWISVDRSRALLQWENTPGFDKDVLDLGTGVSQGQLRGPMPSIASASGSSLAHHTTYPRSDAVAITEDVAYADWLAEFQSSRIEASWSVAPDRIEMQSRRVDALSSDGKRAASIAGSVVTVTSNDGTSAEKATFAADQEVSRVAFSPDGQSLVFAAGTSAHVVDLHTKQVTMVVRSPTGVDIDGLLLAPDRLILGNDAGESTAVPLDLLTEARSRMPRALRVRERIGLGMDCSADDIVKDLAESVAGDAFFEARIRNRDDLTPELVEQAVVAARDAFCREPSTWHMVYHLGRPVIDEAAVKVLLPLAQHMSQIRTGEPEVELVLALAEYHNHLLSSAALRFDELLAQPDAGGYVRIRCLAFRSLIYHATGLPERAQDLLLEYELKHHVRGVDEDMNRTLIAAFGPKQGWGGAKRPVFDEGVRLLENHIWAVGSWELAKASLARLDATPAQQAALLVVGPAYEPTPSELDEVIWQQAVFNQSQDIPWTEADKYEIAGWRRPLSEASAPRQLVDLARRAALRAPHDLAFRRTWAAACYRAGDFGLALALLQWGFESDSLDRDYTASVMRQITRKCAHEALLAMALSRAGQLDRAREVARQLHEEFPEERDRIVREMHWVLSLSGR